MFAHIAIALFLCFQAPAQQASNEPKPATVEGTVTHAASKAPIRKAKVTLSGVGFESSSNVEAAEDGKFIFKDVKPGRYRITAEKTGYETSAYGARKLGEALGQVLRVDAGAALTGIDVMLPKHGVIAGKIVDTEGEPVQRALVLALASMYYSNGKKAQLPRGTVPVMSNDLGEYRIGQLPPGKYILCAIPVGFYQPTLAEKESKAASEETSITTCYPSVQEMAQAAQIEIKDSTEVPGVDVRLTKAKTVSVHGRITGVPAGAGAITILNLNTKTAGPMGNAIHPRTMLQGVDGKFEFKNVVPGTYILHTLPTGLGNAPFMVKSTIEVGDKPVNDLEVPAIVPFEVKCRINAEPGPELKIGSIRVILTPADEITSALAMGTANADGEITLANMTTGRHRVTITGVPSTHYIREIRAGEQVAEGDEVEVPAASTQITIAIALGHAEIGGVAQNEKGEPVPGAMVALIPYPRKPFRLRQARTDQNGVYRLPTLPPGEYYLGAFNTVDAGALEDEEFLKPYLSKLKKVKVEQDGSQDQKLTLLAAQ